LQALNLLHASSGVVTLSTAPGNLFLRALQCAVIPMMFFNITSSGRQFNIQYYTYLMTDTLIDTLAISFR
jgi:hypothetical protein